jgi:multiple sugar transport system substrate-binding protein
MSDMSYRIGSRALGVFVAAALVVSACAPAAQRGGGQASGAPIDLELMAWTYSIDVVRDNLDQFEQMNPGVKVKVSDFAVAAYPETIVTRFSAGGRPPDLMYGFDQWLQQWAAAGWILPVEDSYPKIAEYKADMPPFVSQGLTYNGKMYGLPFYGDLIGFIYNEQLLQAAGLTSPPKTWEEMLAQARIIKQKGVAAYPITMAFNPSDPFAIEILQSMVFSRGGSLFDEDLNPVFNGRDPATAESVDWVRTALAEQLLHPQSLQNDFNANIQSMSAGVHAFTLARITALSTFNDPNTSKAAGSFKMAQMPGSAGATTGFVRMYVMSTNTAKRGKDVQDAAWKLMEFLGGKTNGEYRVAKRWSATKGIGFAQVSLFDDKDIQSAWGKWVDLGEYKQQFNNSRIKQGLTPYFANWDVFTRAEVQKAYLGSEPTAVVLNRLADRWNELKSAAKR